MVGLNRRYLWFESESRRQPQQKRSLFKKLELYQLSRNKLCFYYATTCVCFYILCHIMGITFFPSPGNLTHPKKLIRTQPTKKPPEPNIYIREERRVFSFGLMVRGLSQRPNLTEGPAATWDLRRSTKEEAYYATMCVCFYYAITLRSVHTKQ
jgi:hypothetical protein